jgi:hypothetical protein
MANRWWKDDDAGSQGRLWLWHRLPRWLWGLLLPGGLVMVFLLGSMIYMTGRVDVLAMRSSAEVEAAIARAQAREAEQRDLRRQELQTLLTIADELRRVREVLEARQ